MYYFITQRIIIRYKFKKNYQNFFFKNWRFLNQIISNFLKIKWNGHDLEWESLQEMKSLVGFFFYHNLFYSNRETQHINHYFTIIVWSLDEETKKWPDGVTVREVTTPMWPLSEKTCWLFDKLKTCIFLLYVPKK